MGAFVNNGICIFTSSSMKRVNLSLTSWVHLRCLPPFLSFPIFFEMVAELYGILDCCHCIIWKCCSVAKSYLSLCKPMDCGMPGFSVFHCLPEFVQIHVHWVGDTIQPSHPLSTPSLPAFNLSQHQGLFQWVNSSHQVAKVLELQPKPSVLPMNIQGWFPLGLIALISLKSKGLSRVFYSTTIWKHQFFGTQLSLWSNCHICTWLLEKPHFWLCRPLLAKSCLCFLICYLSWS